MNKRASVLEVVGLYLKLRPRLVPRRKSSPARAPRHTMYRTLCSTKSSTHNAILYSKGKNALLIHLLPPTWCTWIEWRVAFTAQFLSTKTCCYYSQAFSKGVQHLADSPTTVLHANLDMARLRFLPISINQDKSLLQPGVSRV